MTETEFIILFNEKLYDLADVLINYYNPCQIKDNACKLVQDIKNDDKFCCMFYSKDGKEKCVFLKDSGCAFRNIKCKLWLCETAIRGTDIKCIEALKSLESLAKLYDLTRRPHLGEHYVGKNAELKTLNEKQIKTIS